MSYVPEKMIYLCLAHMSESGAEQKYVKEAFDTNWVVPLGPNVNAFEEDLKSFYGGKNEVVALSAGTAAVHLALLGCGVQPGDEVLVNRHTPNGMWRFYLVPIRQIYSNSFSFSSFEVSHFSHF